MAQPTIYLTKDGYIIKTSQDLNFELIRTEKGFMTRNLGKGIIAPCTKRKLKNVPNEVKTIFFNLQIKR